MVASVLSPCLCCGDHLPGFRCVPRQRARCSRFLEYVQRLHRARAHGILISELKEIVSGSIEENTEKVR